MLIDLYELLQEEDGQRNICPAFEAKEFKVNKEVYPVKGYNISFSFHNDGKKHVSFKCTGEVTLQIPCDRCLEPVDYTVNIDCFKDLDLNKTSEERIADLDEEPYLNGTKFNSEVFIANEILVHLPMKVLCRTDCKGICKRCGANLNLGACKCKDTEPGTGMSKILDVFNQFKEV